MTRGRSATALAIMAFLLIPPAAQGQLIDEHQLATVEDIAVVYVYEIHPACLLSPGDLKDEAVWTLKHSGISVVDRPTEAAHQLHINVVAKRAFDGGCMASISTQLGRYQALDTATVEGGTARAFVLAHQGRLSVHIGPEPGFTAQLRVFIRKSVAALAEQIQAAQADR